MLYELQPMNIHEHPWKFHINQPVSWATNTGGQRHPCVPTAAWTQENDYQVTDGIKRILNIDQP